MTKAIYPGSFDPFTNGHLDMVKKASELFDQVIIVVALNKNKSRIYNAGEMSVAIVRTLQANNITNCVVTTWYDLIADLMSQKNIKYLIRGLRNNMDYNYEENIAKINKLINPNIETIYLRANNDISSTMVKELYSFHKDISAYVPPDVLNLMEEHNYD